MVTAATTATATATKTRTPTSERRARTRTVMIAVIVNPRSRANRRNPRIAAEFQAIVGDRGRVFAPKSIEELDTTAAELRQTPPTVIAVHGGDGTLHKTVTALDRVFGAAPLPPIAILCGGTMNVVATSLAIRETPAVFLRAIVDAARRGPIARHDQAPLPAHRRRARVPVRQRPARQLPDRILRAGRLRAAPRRLAARCARSSRRCGTGRSFASCSSASRARCGWTARCWNRPRSSA